MYTRNMEVSKNLVALWGQYNLLPNLKGHSPHPLKKSEKFNHKPKRHMLLSHVYWQIYGRFMTNMSMQMSHHSSIHHKSALEHPSGYLKDIPLGNMAIL